MVDTDGYLHYLHLQSGPPEVEMKIAVNKFMKNIILKIHIGLHADLKRANGRFLHEEGDIKPQIEVKEVLNRFIRVFTE